MSPGPLFHFVDADPAAALETASGLARGLDVRLGGGPSTVRQFLEADLVDFLHLVVVPVTLGEGVQLRKSLDTVRDRFDVETAPSAGGRAHELWNRRRGGAAGSRAPVEARPGTRRTTPRRH